MVHPTIFFGVQPSQIGGAGFRWPIHSMYLFYVGIWNMFFCLGQQPYCTLEGCL